MSTAQGSGRAAGAAVFALATGIALFARQTSFFGDGRDIATLVERGTTVYHHLLYFPLAQAFAWLATPFSGAPQEAGPLLLAALCFGAATAIVLGAARRLGLPPAFALATAAVFAAAPVCVFHATCIEVHGVQLFFAALTARWLVERERSGPESDTGPASRPSALVPALLWIALTGAHLSGGLWAPILLIATLRSRGRWQRPRHLVPALVVLVLGVLAWTRTNTSGSTGRGFVAAASGSVLSVPNDLTFLWSQFVAPFGALTVLASIVVAACALRERSSLGPLDLATALGLVLFAPFAAALALDEQGGYFIALAPTCALVVGRFAYRVSSSIDLGTDPKAARAPLAALWFLAAAHGIGANARWLDYNVRYEGSAWLEPLAQEVGEGGWVLTRSYAQARTVFHHSRLASAPFDDGTAMNVPWEAVAPLALPLVESTAAAGGRGAILTDLFESPKPVHRALVAELVERFGQPVPGRAGGYLLFPDVAAAAQGGGD